MVECFFNLVNNYVIIIINFKIIKRNFFLFICYKIVGDCI